MRLTDTVNARVWEGMVGADRRLSPDVVRTDDNGGLIFLGRPIGAHSVHMAWWNEGNADRSGK